MLRIARRVATTAVLASALGLAGASAASAASISGLSDSAPIVSKLYVPVVMTASCEPSGPFFPFSLASVTIRQVVSGKNIAQGTGTISSLTCDGTDRDYTVNVFPGMAGPFPFPGGGVQGPLFSKGEAVVSATLSTSFGSASAGPEPIRLTK